MKKVIGLFIALVMVLITLTGCVNVNYEIQVNKDGSGEVSYVCGFSKETLESMGVSADDMVGAMKEKAEESEYIVEKYEDDEIAGFKANKHIDDLSKEMSMQEAFGEEYVKDTEENGINVERGLFTTKYSQNAEIDLTNMEELGETIKMTYKVKLPVNVKESNAAEQNKKELKWNLVSGEVNKIEFVAVGFNTLAITIVIVVLLVVCCAITIICTKKTNAKTEKKK